MAKSQQEGQSAGLGSDSEPIGKAKTGTPEKPAGSTDSTASAKPGRRRKSATANKDSNKIEATDKTPVPDKNPGQLKTSDRLEALEAHIIQRINKLEADSHIETSECDSEETNSSEELFPSSDSVRKYRFGEQSGGLKDVPEGSRSFHHSFEATNEVLHELQEMNAALTSAIQSLHFRLSNIEEKLGVEDDDEPGSTRAALEGVRERLDQSKEREEQLTQQLDRGFKLLGNLYLDSRQFLNRNLLNLGCLLIIIVAIAGMLLSKSLYSLKHHLSDHLDGLALEVRSLSDGNEK